MTEKTVPAKKETELPATREEERYLKPPVDIYEKDDMLVVICDMPGVNHSDIQVDVDNNVLTIEGKVKHEKPAEATYQEFSLMNFFRQFELSEEVDQEKITAELKNGVLKILLRKVEKAKPKKIKIKVA